MAKWPFGGMQAGLDLAYSTSMASFTWAGCDEMDEVSGDGHAELLDSGSIEITFAYHNGDEAKREPSSTAFSPGVTRPDPRHVSEHEAVALLRSGIRAVESTERLVKQAEAAFTVMPVDVPEFDQLHASRLADPHPKGAEYEDGRCTEDPARPDDLRGLQQTALTGAAVRRKLASWPVQAVYAY